MKLISSILPCLVITAPLVARDLLPNYWFENVPSADGAIQQSLVFRTVAGVQYQVETSEDLTNWTEGEEIYGMGHEFVVPMREFTPPPPLLPGETPQPLPPPPTAAPTLLLRPATGMDGGTVASWRSLDHGGPMIMHLDGELHQDWAQMPLYSRRHGDFYFFIWRYGPAMPPPNGAPVLGVRDLALIAELEASLPEMNQLVATSAALARNMPPPAPTEPGEKKFWRIRADWSVDTDGDGSPDWAEFEMMGDALHPFHALANAFEADADNNQIADGDQLDFDLDNTADSEDAGKADSAVRKFTIPEPRYALFPITTASPPEPHKRPIQINGQGTVLYVNGTWSGGNWLELTTSAGELTGCVARGINDGGEIVGFGSYELNAEHNRRGSVLTHWPARNAAPAAVSVDDVFAMTYQDLEYSPYRGPVLSNDGRVIAPAATIETLEDDIAEKFVPTPGGSRFMWTLPAIGRTAGKVEVAGGMSLVGASGAYWGFDVETGKGFINGAGNLAPLDWVPLNVVEISPGIPVAFGSTETLVHYNGSWHAAGTYAKTSDMSDEGIAIARSPSGMLAPILVNGKWRPIYRAASSNLPEEWRSSDVQLLDTSSNGWVLGKRGEGDGATYAAMFPLKVEGEFLNSKGITVRKFTGVDDFSVAADTVSLPALDRLWIMAPQSTTKTTTFKAPLTGGSPVTISGTGITFGGDLSVTLSEEETTVAVQAAATSSSGDEVLAELTLDGGATSVSKPLGFKIMKDRTVRVAVYKVTKADASGNPEVIPTLIPDEQELEDLLNDVFKPQLNTTFSVKIEPDPLVAAWDLGGKDGSLDGDPNSTTENHSDEQEIVQSEKESRIQEQSEDPENTPFEEHITVFIVGSQKLISGTAFASAIGNERTCWIFGNLDAYTDLNPVRPYDPEEGHLRTIAHEIGHILVGDGHPDQRAYPGPAPLPGTEHRRRLMCSGGTSGLNPGNLLVKGEWDEAEKWLNAIVDAPGQ